MGFFGGLGKFLSNPNTMGILSDTLGGLAGREPVWAQGQMKQRALEAERNKPYRFQNNNGDVVEVDPASGQQRVLYKDTPKQEIPELARQVAYWRSVGREDLAADIEAKARLMTETYVDPDTGAINMKGVRASDLLRGAPTPAPQRGGPQPGTIEDGYIFNGGDPADPNNWKPVQGGAGLQTPRMFP